MCKKKECLPYDLRGYKYKWISSVCLVNAESGVLLFQERLNMITTFFSVSCLEVLRYDNAIAATVCSHAKVTIRAIGYDSCLTDMLNQLENHFELGEITDILLKKFHQMM